MGVEQALQSIRPTREDELQNRDYGGNRKGDKMVNIYIFKFGLDVVYICSSFCMKTADNIGVTESN